MGRIRTEVFRWSHRNKVERSREKRNVHFILGSFSALIGSDTGMGSCGAFSGPPFGVCVWVWRSLCSLLGNGASPLFLSSYYMVKRQSEPRLRRLGVGEIWQALKDHRSIQLAKE